MFQLISLVLFSLWSADVDTLEARAKCKEASAAIRSASVEQKVVREQSAVRPEKLPELSHETVKRINLSRDHLERCRIVLDAGKSQWKQDTEDLRNLTLIIQANQVPPEQLMNVSRSHSLLVWDEGLARWSPAAGNLMIKQRSRPSDDSEQLMFETPLQTGCIPDSIFHARLVDARTTLWDGRELVALTFEAQGDTLEIRLDREISYRYRFWERRMGARIIEQRTAGDYRTINGIPYPFVHETTRWNAKGEKVFQERTLVETVKLNLTINETDLALSIPKASVTDLRRKSTLPLREPRVLTVGTLLTLGEELEAQSARENAERIRQWQAERLRQGLPIDRSVAQNGLEEVPATGSSP